MRTRTFIVVASLVAGCAAPSKSERSAGHAMISSSMFRGIAAAPAWTPSDAEVAQCELALGAALAKKKKDVANYYLRMSGIVRDGSRFIVGDACDKATPDAARYLAPPSEGSVLLGPFGGGETYFSFDYDAGREEITMLKFNAAL